MKPAQSQGSTSPQVGPVVNTNPAPNIAPPEPQAQPTIAAKVVAAGEDLRKLLDRPLSQMKASNFQELAKNDPVAAGRVSMALLKMNTAELPETVFVRREAGMLKKIRCRVQLKNGQHLSSWKASKKKQQPGEGAEEDSKAKKMVYSINAAGYRYLNQYVGLQVITPPEVVVNDQRQPNPYVEVDPVTSLPVRVYCRKLALGPSQATGALVATDVMIRLDLNIYLVEMLLAKLKWQDEGSENWGIVGGPEERPPERNYRTAWRFLPILSIGGLGIWINAAHPSMLQFLSEHMTRTKFIDRIVQTMTERNALKAHPSMPSSIGAVVNDVAIVDTFGWTRDWTRAELEEIEGLAMNNRLDEVVDEVLTTEVTTSDVVENEGESVVAEGLENELETEQVEGGAAKKEEREDDEQEPEAMIDADALSAQALQAIATYKRVNGPKPTKEKLKGIIGEKKPEEASLDELKQIVVQFGPKQPLKP